MEMLCVYCDVGTEFLYVISKIIIRMRAKCNLYDVFATKAAQRTINITILHVAKREMSGSRCRQIKCDPNNFNLKQFVLEDDCLNQSEALYTFLSPSSAHLKQVSPSPKKSKFSLSTLFKR